MSGLTREQGIDLIKWIFLGPTVGDIFLGHKVEHEISNDSEPTYRVVCPDGTIYARYMIFPSTIMKNGKDVLIL